MQFGKLRLLVIVQHSFSTLEASGFCDILGLHGILFKGNEKAAFSNYLLWESVGWISAYILQTKVLYSKSKYEQTKYILILGMHFHKALGTCCISLFGNWWIPHSGMEHKETEAFK